MQSSGTANVEYHIERLKLLLGAVSPYAQVLIMGDDLGMQTGPQLGPKMYREFFFPRQKEISRFVKKNSNLLIFLNSCESISLLLPDLIVAGLDIVNPVQTRAKDMAPEEFKREFGQDIVFGGGAEWMPSIPFLMPLNKKSETR